MKKKGVTFKEREEGGILKHDVHTENLGSSLSLEEIQDTLLKIEKDLNEAEALEDIKRLEEEQKEFIEIYLEYLEAKQYRYYNGEDVDINKSYILNLLRDIFFAITENDYQVVREATEIPEFNILARNFPNRQTMLHVAVSYRVDVNIVTLLLDRGVRDSAEDLLGLTALHYACFNKAAFEIIAFFLENLRSQNKYSIDYKIFRKAVIDILSLLLNINSSTNFLEAEVPANFNKAIEETINIIIFLLDEHIINTLELSNILSIYENNVNEVLGLLISRNEGTSFIDSFYRQYSSNMMAILSREINFNEAFNLLIRASLNGFQIQILVSNSFFEAISYHLIYINMNPPENLRDSIIDYISSHESIFSELVSQNTQYSSVEQYLAFIAQNSEIDAIIMQASANYLDIQINLYSTEMVPRSFRSGSTQLNLFMDSFQDQRYYPIIGFNDNLGTYLEIAEVSYDELDEEEVDLFIENFNNPRDIIENGPPSESIDEIEVSSLLEVFELSPQNNAILNQTAVGEVSGLQNGLLACFTQEGSL